MDAADDGLDEFADQARAMRERMRPANAAAGMLKALGEHFSRFFPGQDFNSWMTNLTTHLGSDFDGDLLAQTFSIEGDDETDADILALHEGIAYCVQALNAQQNGQESMAWTYVFSAAQWEGYLSGRAGIEPASATGRAVAGRKAEATWIKLVREHVSEIDAAYPPRATAEDFGRWLAKRYPGQIRFNESTRSLKWRHPTGSWKEVSKGTIANRVSEARAR